MATQLQLVAGTLPVGYCFTTAQVLYNDMFRLGYALFPPDLTTFLTGGTTPAPEDQDKVWFKTVGGVYDRAYVFHPTIGVWVAPYRVPAGPNGERMMWVGTLSDLIVYDGGDLNAVGLASGAFWEEDADFAARSPMGVGTLALSGQLVSVGLNTGEERHAMTTAEMPSHVHETNIKLTAGGGASGSGGDPSVSVGTPSNDTTATGGGTPGLGTPFNVVHPVRGAYFVKRTVRAFYRGA